MSKLKSTATRKADSSDTPRPMLSQDARRKAKDLSKHRERETEHARKRAAKTRA